MKRILFLKLTAISCAAFLHFGSIGDAKDNLVPFPSEYRKWIHVRTAVVEPGSRLFKKFGGINHIYANEKALVGYDTARFEDGSVIVIDVFDLNEKNGNRIEGSRRFIQVMHKDSKRFPDTGGWGFEEFTGSSQTERVLTPENVAQCFACHASQKDRGYVFSKFRE